MNARTGDFVMNRAQREKQLMGLIHTASGRATIKQLYEHLYLAPGEMIPPGFMVEQDLIQLILAKEFPDDEES